MPGKFAPKNRTKKDCHFVFKNWRGKIHKSIFASHKTKQKVLCSLHGIGYRTNEGL